MLAIIYQEFPKCSNTPGDEKLVKRVVIPRSGFGRFWHQSKLNDVLAITYQEFLKCSNTPGDEKFVKRVAIPRNGFGSFGNHRSELNNRLAITGWESFHSNMEG